MAASTSKNPSFIVEVGEEYPYPSHFAPNFVTVKLSGKNKYDVWKTQMLCLLRSHGMLGFIDGTFVSPYDDQNHEKRKLVKDKNKAWMRSDSLVTGWILGSLSEEAAMEVVNCLTSKHNTTDFTAKDAWDELQRSYGPSVADRVYVAVCQFLQKRHRLDSDAHALLSRVNLKIRDTTDSSNRYYTNPLFEATRLNESNVVTWIVGFFPNAIWNTNDDGHNFIQYSVINHSEKIYNLLYQMSEHNNIYKTIKDDYGNNLLHLAARLAPSNKLNLISGAALQVQRELQWFKEVEGFVRPLNKIQKNSSNETPEMVFTREHKELVIEGEKWMKSTAESYTITAALITTIVFAAAITVPGGNNQDTGVPIFSNKATFTIFAISDAISLFTAVTSLLMFLSILTTRFAEQDFLFKLPKRLIIGLATLFISTTAMIIAFGATLFLVFGQENSWIFLPIGVLTCLPITSFVTLQFPLIADLMSATYGRSIFVKKKSFNFYY